MVAEEITAAPPRADVSNRKMLLSSFVHWSVILSLVISRTLKLELECVIEFPAAAIIVAQLFPTPGE